jgi:hypothetical protein
MIKVLLFAANPRSPDEILLEAGVEDVQASELLARVSRSLQRRLEGRDEWRQD